MLVTVTEHAVERYAERILGENFVRDEYFIRKAITDALRAGTRCVRAERLPDEWLFWQWADGIMYVCGEFRGRYGTTVVKVNTLYPVTLEQLQTEARYGIRSLGYRNRTARRRYRRTSRHLSHEELYA